MRRSRERLDQAGDLGEGMTTRGQAPLAMTLTLTITNADRLGNGAPLHIALHGRGAVIGRSAQCDWTLPDPDKYVSSRHCEISFADGGYVLADISTNGTMLNGAAERMGGPRPIQRGDRFQIGRYEIIALLSEVALDAETLLERDEPHLPDAPPPPEADRAPDVPVIAAPPPVADAVAHRIAPANMPGPVADPERPPQATADDDVRRDAPASTGALDPAVLIEAFATAAGLNAGQLKASATDTFERAGSMLKHLVAGLVTLVDARARAKSELGAERTALSFDGNNPIKFARRPEQALAQLLNTRERGFMDAGAAVDDAFDDLQAHQLATLRAMQGALRSTLDRFSPAAIKTRAGTKGLRAKIIPGAREAALWQAYEREFAGVAQGSDEAFMDVFAREFRQAYVDLASTPG